MIGRLFALTFIATASSLTAAACSAGNNAPTEDVGEISAAISQVPSQVGCIEIDVTGARSVSRRFDVTSGQSAVLSMTGLPLGLDTFVGLAYPGACSAVTSATQATWISDPTQATLVAQQVTNINLTLHPNGQSSIGVTFQGDDGGSEDSGIDAASACAAPQILCGAVCTNPATDPTNCGACGASCNAPGAATACVAGACQIAACTPGFADCDHVEADGCETNTSSDVANCGACGNACHVANGTPACATGACKVASCLSGFADCDGVFANGCETNLNSATNCGTCGHACTGLLNVCTGGVCEL